MTFQEFRSTFRNYPLFSILDIEKLFPTFDYKNLVNWQHKNYVQKIRNSWYRLTENTLDMDTVYFISNHIYHPSYISLEMALSFYGFIPEGVFKITAISTLKTQQFTTPIGVFGYQNFKPSLYFGYKLLSFGKFQFKIAEPEKAILDYLYLHPDVNTDEHLFELRLNTFEMKEQINIDTLNNYCELIGSKLLSNRVKTFIKFIENA
jgi:predicted transcriptional regulator of viral defense system